MASYSEGSESGLRSQGQSQQESQYYEEAEEEEEEEEEEDLQLIDEEDDSRGTGSESQFKGEPSKPSPKGKSTNAEMRLRRQMQNKINQRRYRQRKREREEAERRETENQDKAASAYVTSDPAELQSSSDLSGIPWGGLNMQYIVGKGKAKEDRSRPSSREPSTTLESRAGGSSRLGLNLADRFWRRRYPPWQPLRNRYPRRGPL